MNAVALDRVREGAHHVLLADDLVEGLRAVAAIEGRLAGHSGRVYWRTGHPPDRIDESSGGLGSEDGADDIDSETERPNMRRLRKRTIPAAAMALATAAVLAPAAIGGDDGTGQGAGGVKSRITIEKIKATGASGKVTSREKKCENDRRVQFFRLDDFISVKIDITRLNHGDWRTKKDLQPGTYFVKVDSVEGCRYDVSEYKKLR